MPQHASGHALQVKQYAGNPSRGTSPASFGENCQALVSPPASSYSGKDFNRQLRSFCQLLSSPPGGPASQSNLLLTKNLVINLAKNQAKTGSSHIAQNKAKVKQTSDENRRSFLREGKYLDYMKDKCHCDKHKKEYAKYSIYDESKRPDDHQDSAVFNSASSPMPLCQMSSSYGQQWNQGQYATLDDRLREPECHQPSFHIRPIPAEPTSKVIFTNQQSSLPGEDSSVTHVDIHPATR